MKTKAEETREAWRELGEDYLEKMEDLTTKTQEL